MASVVEVRSKGKKNRVLEPVQWVQAEEYDGAPVEVKLACIQALIPVALREVQRILEEEVNFLSGERYAHAPGGKSIVRYGRNPGSIQLAGQRVAIRIPRVRDVQQGQEVPLQTLAQLRAGGAEDDVLLRTVLHGLSCREYASAARAVPGAIGLSASTVSRQFIAATEQCLRELQERDLSGYDLVALWLDGKTFAEDTLVVAVGLTSTGEKVMLGLVQAGTENEAVLTPFLQGLIERGLQVKSGLLVILDGGKGLRAAVEKALGQQALVQRCQWHKRENVVSHLPKGEQRTWRKRLQQAYERPTYKEAKAALMRLHKELEQRNLSAANSLLEGLEDTLTLHRLGLFELLGASLKTTNCIESIFSQIERRCQRVGRWLNSSQKQRWLAGALLDVEPRLNRVRGYQYLPLLRSALQRELKLLSEGAVA